jgi:hypothetical protein
VGRDRVLGNRQDEHLDPVRELPGQLSVGDARNMTVSWHMGLAHISGVAPGMIQ